MSQPRILQLPEDVAQTVVQEEKVLHQLQRQQRIQHSILAEKQQKIRDAAISMKIIDAYDDDIPTFRAVGKIYVSRPQQALRTDFEKQKAQVEKHLEQSEKMVETLDKKVNDQRKNIDEIIRSASSS